MTTAASTDGGVSGPALWERAIDHSWDTAESQVIDDGTVIQDLRHAVEELNDSIYAPYVSEADPDHKDATLPKLLQQPFNGLRASLYPRHPTNWRAIKDSDERCMTVEENPYQNLYGTIHAQFRDGSTDRYPYVKLDHVYKSSPLLAAAFEHSRMGYFHCIDDTSPEAVAALLRYVRIKQYFGWRNEEQAKSDPLLFHLEVYLLAHKYDIEALKKQVKGQLMCEVEAQCNYPWPPADLVPAIEFVYEYLPQHRDIIEIFTNYCIYNLHQQKLDRHEGFTRLAYDNRQFRADLCKTNWDRRFIDEAAFAIVQLPVKPTKVDTTLSERALGDYLAEMWSGPETPRLAPTKYHSGYKLHPGDPSNASRSGSCSSSGSDLELDLPFRRALQNTPQQNRPEPRRLPTAIQLKMDNFRKSRTRTRQGDAALLSDSDTESTSSYDMIATPSSSGSLSDREGFMFV